MPGRRLLFFFDGTSNRAAGPKDVVLTNVFRLNQAFTFGFSGTPQIAFYFSGVGTRGDTISAATGRGFDQIVTEAFINLASNYLDGDTIYLFGFSRGAAAARALSGLLSDPGLISADTLAFFPDLWRYFVDTRLRAGEKGVIRSRLQEVVFHPRIEFLGVFDTVAGTSWDRLSLFTKVRFRGLRLDRSVKCGVQILSIDDNRNPSFEPLLWERKSEEDQILEQIWMPGVHADIGGCSDGTLLGDIALLTMIERIEKYCPELEWDVGLVDRITKRIESAEQVEISDERPDLLRRMLWRRSRGIPKIADSYIHPVYANILGRKLSIRGACVTYESKNYKGDLPVLPTSNADLYRKACERALDATCTRTA